jgi:hypothetical protein
MKRIWARSAPSGARGIPALWRLRDLRVLRGESGCGSCFPGKDAGSGDPAYSLRAFPGSHRTTITRRRRRSSTLQRFAQIQGSRTRPAGEPSRLEPERGSGFGSTLRHDGRRRTSPQGPHGGTHGHGGPQLFGPRLCSARALPLGLFLQQRSNVSVHRNAPGISSMPARARVGPPAPQSGRLQRPPPRARRVCAQGPWPAPHSRR